MIGYNILAISFLINWDNSGNLTSLSLDKRYINVIPPQTQDVY